MLSKCHPLRGTGGYHLGLLTNGSERHRLSKLDVIELLEFFDVVGVAEVIGVQKPDVEASHALARSLDVPPRQCLFIGDNPDQDVARRRQPETEVALGVTPDEGTAPISRRNANLNDMSTSRSGFKAIALAASVAIAVLGLGGCATTSSAAQPEPTATKTVTPPSASPPSPTPAVPVTTTAVDPTVVFDASFLKYAIRAGLPMGSGDWANLPELDSLIQPAGELMCQDMQAGMTPTQVMLTALSGIEAKGYDDQTAAEIVVTLMLATTDPGSLCPHQRQNIPSSVQQMQSQLSGNG